MFPNDTASPTMGRKLPTQHVTTVSDEILVLKWECVNEDPSWDCSETDCNNFWSTWNEWSPCTIFNGTCGLSARTKACMGTTCKHPIPIGAFQKYPPRNDDLKHARWYKIVKSALFRAKKQIFL